MNRQQPVCACARRRRGLRKGRGPSGAGGGSGSRPRSALALLVAPGHVSAQAQRLTAPLPHTKPRRGENGGRGRSGGRGGGDGAQDGGRERRARRAEWQRGSGPEGVGIPRFLVPGRRPRGGSVRSVGGLFPGRPRRRPFPAEGGGVAAESAGAGRPPGRPQDRSRLPGGLGFLTPWRPGPTPLGEASGPAVAGAGDGAGAGAGDPGVRSGDLGRAGSAPATRRRVSVSRSVKQGGERARGVACGGPR